MREVSNNLEALNLISDWAKWLVAIQTGVIALIGTLFTSEHSPASFWSKLLGTSAIICFLFSIAAAGILLLTLPEIAQYLQPKQNIWTTRDSIAYQLVRLNTQGFAILESVFFGLRFNFCRLLHLPCLYQIRKTFTFFFRDLECYEIT